jgi:ABC-type transport system involved in multi-copper enzyme maturation permease subunit
MAVHNLGYRAWSGELAPAWSRFVVITTNGVRRAWTSRWLRRGLTVAWMPALYFAGMFFIFEQALINPEWRRTLEPMIQGMPGAIGVNAQLNMGDDSELRHSFWSMMLHTFFRGPQAYLMVMMVGIIAPPLISQDIRSRAFLLYFSRPMGRWEYILGKVSTIWAYLTLISFAPGLVLYLLGVLLSPGFDVVLSTWDLPFRIALASAFMMVPTASLALCFSSMTQESRVAAFAWFAVWILGAVAFGTISVAQGFNELNQPPEDLIQMGEDGALVVVQQPKPPISNWTYLSLYDTWLLAQSWAFGFESFDRAKVAILLMIALTAVSAAVVYRKVSAPMRA